MYILDAALAHWPFLRQVMAAGCGSNLVRALGEVAVATSDDHVASSSRRCSERNANSAAAEEEPEGLAEIAVSGIALERLTKFGSVRKQKESARESRTRCLSTNAVDTLCWLRRFQHDFEADPLKMEELTYVQAPINTKKYAEALSRLPRSLRCIKDFGRADAWPQGEAVYKGHTNRVTSVAFSADGRTVLTGSFDNTARLWEVAKSLCEHS